MSPSPLSASSLTFYPCDLMAIPRDIGRALKVLVIRGA